MVIEKIKDDDLEFMQCWFTPQCLAESLFSNFDNFGLFDDNFGEIRIYQLPFLSYEPIIDENVPGLSEKEQFKLRKGAGDVYNLGARKYGKSLITLKIDIALASVYDDGWWEAFYSIDEKRLRNVLDSVKTAMEYHPIFKMWDVNCSYKPEIKFYGKKNRWLLQGVNLILKGKSPGEQFYGLHVKKLFGDEVSFETQSVYEKRKEALSELGAVTRLSGMTNFNPNSPIGKTFSDPMNKAKIINLPQYVNPYWDDDEKLDRIKDYGGAESLNYKVFVEGEIVKDGTTEFDIDRVQQCYNRKKTIKNFEITKDNFSRFRNLLVVVRPKNAERIFLSSDVGDKQTEIIIHSEIGENYSYLYNITLYNLKLDEQEEIFNYLIETLEANVIAYDCGDAFGRVLADHTETKYGKEHVIRYAGASKIAVAFEKNENGDIILENGKPVEKQEFMSEWSVRRLKDLLYENKVVIPIDYKFDMQILQVQAFRSGTRVRYECIMENDHLWSAWRVWAIAQWLAKAFNITPKIKPSMGTGANSWDSKK